MATKADSDLVLTWKKVLYLAPIAVLGAIVGQVTFDVTNALTGGVLSGFLVNILIKPIVPYFWPAFDTSIFLFRWILGAGGIGLSLALALRFSPKKAVSTSLVGCAAGLVGWVLTSYVAHRIPILTPFIFRTILPPAFIFLVLGITLNDIRRITLKLMLGAVLGSILGTIFIVVVHMFSLGATIKLLEDFSQIGLGVINPIRLIDSILVMLSINLVCLSLLKKTLRTKLQELPRVKE